MRTSTRRRSSPGCSATPIAPPKRPPCAVGDPALEVRPASQQGLPLDRLRRPLRPRNSTTRGRVSRRSCGTRFISNRRTRPPTTPAASSASSSANSYLHRVEDPAEVIGRIASWLTPDGMVYVDEFVGPDRFQWAETQIEIVNRLLSALPDELRMDLAGGEEAEGADRPTGPRPLRPRQPHRGRRQLADPRGPRVRAGAGRGAPLRWRDLPPALRADHGQLRPAPGGRQADPRNSTRSSPTSGVVGSDYLWGAYRAPSRGSG